MVKRAETLLRVCVISKNTLAPLLLETEFSFQDSNFLFILLELGIGLRVEKIEEQKFKRDDKIT